MLDDIGVQRVFVIFEVPDTGEPFKREWMGTKDDSLILLARVDLGKE
jgi:hypothetical protein